MTGSVACLELKVRHRRGCRAVGAGECREPGAPTCSPPPFSAGKLLMPSPRTSSGCRAAVARGRVPVRRSPPDRVPQLLADRRRQGYDWLSFHDCVIQESDLTDHDGYTLPHFQNCLIGQMTGVAGVVGAAAGPVRRLRGGPVRRADVDSQGHPRPEDDAAEQGPAHHIEEGLRPAGRGPEGAPRSSADWTPSTASLSPKRCSGSPGPDLSPPPGPAAPRLYLPVRGMASRVRRILQAPQSSADSILD